MRSQRCVLHKQSGTVSAVKTPKLHRSNRNDSVDTLLQRAGTVGAETCIYNLTVAQEV